MNAWLYVAAVFGGILAVLAVAGLVFLLLWKFNELDPAYAIGLLVIVAACAIGWSVTS